MGVNPPNSSSSHATIARIFGPFWAWAWLNAAAFFHGRTVPTSVILPTPPCPTSGEHDTGATAPSEKKISFAGCFRIFLLFLRVPVSYRDMRQGSAFRVCIVTDTNFPTERKQTYRGISARLCNHYRRVRSQEKLHASEYDYKFITYRFLPNSHLRQHHAVIMTLYEMPQQYQWQERAAYILT